jgi:hypothetical protein
VYHTIWTVLRVEAIGNAAIVTPDVVEPAVVGVKNDRGVHSLTSMCVGASLRGEERVNLRSVCTRLLGEHRRRKDGEAEKRGERHGDGGWSQRVELERWAEELDSSDTQFLFMGEVSIAPADPLWGNIEVSPLWDQMASNRDFASAVVLGAGQGTRNSRMGVGRFVARCIKCLNV